MSFWENPQHGNQSEPIQSQTQRLFIKVCKNLQYLGYPPIDIHDLDEPKFISDLMITFCKLTDEYSSVLERKKIFEHKFYVLERDSLLYEQKLETIRSQRTLYRRQNDQLKQRMKQKERQIKQINDKKVKEKEECLKQQKKISDHTERGLKVDLKKCEDKIKILDAKLKKYLDKEKVQYINSFQIMNSISNNGQLYKKNQNSQQVQGEFFYQMEKKMNQENKRLQNIVNFYTERLQQIYQAISKIASSCEERSLNERKWANISLILLPHENSQYFIGQLNRSIETLKQFVATSFSNKAKTINIQKLPQDVQKLAAENLKMRQYYGDWQHLFKNMKGLAKSSMELALRYKKVQSQTIRQIHNQLNQGLSGMQLAEEAQQNSTNIITKMRQAMELREREQQDFLHNKVNFIKNELQVSQRINEDIQNLLSNRDSS